MTTAANAVAKFDTLDLQHARRTIEAELIDACFSGVKGTQAHAGQMEVLAAIGEELRKRNALVPPPPYEEVNMEDGVRLSFSVRVF